jgi:hypothetical protein
MGNRLAPLVLSLGIIALISSSCSSSDDDSQPAANAGDAGQSGSAGRAGDAGGAGSSGLPQSGAGGGGAIPSAGAAGDVGDEASGGAGGVARESGGAGAGASAGAGGAFIGVAETACVEHSDCLPVCQHYGWPSAKCFGYCYCVAENGSPSCTPGTTEGCPPGTQCRGGSGCRPYGTGVDDDPCPIGNECAVGYECIGYGNPLPNGNSTACRHLCDNQHPLPADCYSCENNDYCDPHPAGGAAGK